MQHSDSIAEPWKRCHDLDALSSPSPNPPRPGGASLRRRIRKAVLRYLAWRIVFDLQRLDPAMLEAASIEPDDVSRLFLSAASGYLVRVPARRRRW